MQENFIGQVAGTLSTILFIASNFPMLLKVVRTRNVKSYSLANIALANLGNAFYWFYVVSIPFGPIWFVQGFYTFSNFLMLVWYFRHSK